MFFDLDEITSEQIALDCADELVKEAFNQRVLLGVNVRRSEAAKRRSRCLCLGGVLKDGSPLFLR